MKFEWDEKKNQRNMIVHGIDFNDAKAIFEHKVLTRIDTRKDYGEERLIGLGQLSLLNLGMKHIAYTLINLRHFCNP